MHTNTEDFQFVKTTRCGNHHLFLTPRTHRHAMMFIDDDGTLLSQNQLMTVSAYLYGRVYIDSVRVPRYWSEARIREYFARDCETRSTTTRMAPAEYKAYLSNPFTSFRLEWTCKAGLQTAWMGDRRKPWEMKNSMKYIPDLPIACRNALTLGYVLYEPEFTRGLVFVALRCGMPVILASTFVNFEDKDKMHLPLHRCIEAMQNTVADSAYVIHYGRVPAEADGLAGALAEVSAGIFRQSRLKLSGFFHVSHFMVQQLYPDMLVPTRHQRIGGGSFYEY